jgi:membrane associated rhomboid family serine protease
MQAKRMNDLNAPPLNPLPPVVWLLALPMIGIELAVNAGSAGMVGGPTAIGWRPQIQQLLGFDPNYMRQLIEHGQLPLESLQRLVTYPFVHTDVSHAMFVVVILLALGKFVGEV